MQKVWRIKDHDPSISRNLATQLGIPLLIAQLLVNRGIIDKESGYAFLNPSLSQLHPPDKMPDINKAINRINQAIENHEKIWIYGDYDVDGVTSVCLLYLCLKKLNADVQYYIPSRFDEGYGLNKDSIAEIKHKGCDLIITVDSGITSVNEVRFANESGMDVIITDHHNPHEELPPAYALVNPKIKGSDYPYKWLAGVGVTFKLVQALINNHKISEQFLIDNLDFAALGTMADIVPLTEENRVIASLGLRILNNMEKPGIKAVCETASLKKGKIDNFAVAFRINPRLNSAGRMDKATKAVELLLSDSYQEALEIAQKLNSANSDRQKIERNIIENAKKQAQQFDIEHLKALVISGENWHQGVIGIAASKIKDMFYRPTILISIEGDTATGSARSIPSFDIHKALAKCSHLLERYGGHKGAAGFTIFRNNIEKFRHDFIRIAHETISDDDLYPELDIDAESSLSDLTMEAVEDLSLLEPYGIENPEPLIMIRNLSIKNMNRTKTNEHLQLSLSNGKEIIRSIAFNMGRLERDLSEKDIKIDVVCKPEINEWEDTRNINLNIKEIKIHHGDSSEDVTIASAELLEPIQIKIVDRRGNPDKKQYLQKLAQSNEKSLMYVRDDSAINQLIKIIKPIVPENKIGICYSTSSEDESDKIKSMFVGDKIKTIISSIPIEEPLIGLEHLVFCHPVVNKDTFIASCSPAIESSAMVKIHLLYNNSDIEYLTTLLERQYPDRQMLINVYRKIKEICREEPIPFEMILSEINIEEPKDLVISNCIDIFEELNIVKRQQDNGKITISILPEPEKRRDLRESQIYINGDRIKSEWLNFSRFMINKTPEEIYKMIIEQF